MKTAEDEPKLLNLVEAGQRLGGMSERSVRRLIDSRQLVAVNRNPGGHYAKLAVSELEIDRFLEANQTSQPRSRRNTSSKPKPVDMTRKARL